MDDGNTSPSRTLACGGPDDGDSTGAGASHSGHQLDGCEAVAKAIESTLGVVMREFDSRSKSAERSQDELSLAIDRLTGELDKLLEDAPVPLIMRHAAKISSIRKRISAMNLLLKSIQRRMDRIDFMLSSGSLIEKVPGGEDVAPMSSSAM
ncbi:Snapin/Pallidin/Snn1 protein [Dioscorea alata]|uniref:Snapin/Pallidin/Snn1 protein n=1 Tax=Dioscorea alata TaxID=55571 RepID=A0ACB7U268_DIOAL|nr:Snapin/Pallidin/Snn1 protein [Dioscorea alata]